MAGTTLDPTTGVRGIAVRTSEVQVGQFIYWRGMFREVLGAELITGVDGLVDQVQFRLAGTRAIYRAPLQWDGDPMAAATTQETLTPAQAATV